MRRSPDLPPSPFACCGVRVDPVTPDEALLRLRELAQDGQGHEIHLCNAYTLSLAVRNRSFSAELNTAALNLPDGTPVVWAARRAGHRIAGPVRGPSLMLSALREGAAWGARHYFYGSSPATIAALQDRLPVIAPGATAVGFESPPFRDLNEREAEEAIERIRDTKPNYVWVGLGTPRQDSFVSKYAAKTGAACIAVGAAFDFAAGTKPEAPAWMHGSGVEWTYRLAREPKRLWRRYLVGNASFTWHALLNPRHPYS